MKPLQKVIDELKSKGYKNTKYRTALLRIFYSGKYPLSVQEILARLEKIELSPNKTTVYRELYFLIEQQLIKAIDLGEEHKRYELADLDHHHHIICTNCQKIEDVVIDEDLSKIELAIRRLNKFTVTEHMLEFYGLCSQCCA